MTRCRRGQWLAGVAGLGAVVAVAGCSSATTSTATATSTPAATSSQAQAERSAVLPVAKRVYAQVTGGGVGWSAVITGGYENCGTNDPLAASPGSGTLQYTATELMTPFSHAVSYTTFSRQVVEVLKAAGLTLRQQSSSAAGTSDYTAHDSGLDLRLVEYNDQGSLGPTATIYLSGQCFDAGSAAQHLLQESPVDQLREPRPTSTPTPKYS
jgi:hypothetical protein